MIDPKLLMTPKQKEHLKIILQAMHIKSLSSCNCEICEKLLPSLKKRRMIEKKYKNLTSEEIQEAFDAWHIQTEEIQRFENFQNSK